MTAFASRQKPPISSQCQWRYGFSACVQHVCLAVPSWVEQHYCTSEITFLSSIVYYWTLFQSYDTQTFGLSYCQLGSKINFNAKESFKCQYDRRLGWVSLVRYKASQKAICPSDETKNSIVRIKSMRFTCKYLYFLDAKYKVVAFSVELYTHTLPQLQSQSMSRYGTQARHFWWDTQCRCNVM